MIKLIHPKTEVIREVPESAHNKRNILKRAGFIRFENYRPPKKKEVVPEPTVSDGVEKHKQEAVDPAGVDQPVSAIHASGAARQLIKKNDLDPALIEGTGKDGQITKPDVKAYLKGIEEAEEELPEQPPIQQSAADIPTHDDPEPPAHSEGGSEPVVRDATEEEEAEEVELSGVATDVDELKESPTANTEEDVE